MYGHSFQDLDGHVWEVMWMDPAAVQPTESQVARTRLAASAACAPARALP